MLHCKNQLIYTLITMSRLATCVCVRTACVAVSMTAPSRLPHVFVAMKVWLSRQTFCRDKIMFVAKKYF